VVHLVKHRQQSADPAVRSLLAGQVNSWSISTLEKFNISFCKSCHCEKAYWKNLSYFLSKTAPKIGTITWCPVKKLLELLSSFLVFNKAVPVCCLFQILNCYWCLNCMSVNANTGTSLLLVRYCMIVNANTGTSLLLVLYDCERQYRHFTVTGTVWLWTPIPVLMQRSGTRCFNGILNHPADLEKVWSITAKQRGWRHDRKFSKRPRTRPLRARHQVLQVSTAYYFTVTGTVWLWTP
jgi:hypothetical protein